MILDFVFGKLEWVNGKCGKSLRSKRKEADAVDVRTVEKLADTRVLTLVA